MKYKIIAKFGDADVRKKSQKHLAPFLREWPSVDATVPLHQNQWSKPRRRVNVVGYPPLDIYAEWLMDFASISAGQLRRADWRNFRRQLLLHVPECPFFCWYCFNDAWPCDNDALPPDKKDKRASRGEVELSEIIAAFQRAQRENKIDGEQINVLRISGGEPFTQPLLIADLAREFRLAYAPGDEDTKAPSSGDSGNAFLWVDTNLYPFNGKIDGDDKIAVAALLELKERVAIHACLHGADDDSLRRNTNREKAEFENLRASLKALVEAGLHVYPRLNPIGLSAAETEMAFRALQSVRDDMPAMTYLGPVELHYPASADRLRVYSGQEPLHDVDAKRDVTRRAAQPILHAPNAAIYTWNRLMVEQYGFGYGVVPRHLAVGAEPVARATASAGTRESARPSRPPPAPDSWQDLLLVTKAWEKDVYALKLLELLGMPEGAILDVEYENKWVDPLLVGYAYGAGKHSTIKKALCVAVPKVGEPGKIIPLRWARVVELKPDSLDENYSTQMRLQLEGYANRFEEELLVKEYSSLAENLAVLIGASNLPFASNNGYFCRYVGLPLKIIKRALFPNRHAATGEDESAVFGTDDGFKAVVLELVKAAYPKAKPDVYYRISRMSRRGSSAESAVMKLNEDGILEVFEDDELFITLEACNPKLEVEGYPALAETEISVETTHPDLLTIAPKCLRLSKFGETEVRIRFPSKGEFEGAILFKPTHQHVRISELVVPFSVCVEQEEKGHV